jgi:hypothetical protein
MYWDRFGNRNPTPEERANTAEAIATQANLAKEEAEAIALQASLAQQQAEALLKKYSNRFGDIPE